MDGQDDGELKAAAQRSAADPHASPEQCGGEAARLRAVRSYHAVDALRDAALDALVAVASKVCEAPIALVTIVDEQKQYFLASLGLGGVSETPRETSFCTHAIRGSDIMVVEDATKDVRFAQNPLVLGEPHIRFYAGCPLIDKEGHALGTLCVVGSAARSLSPHQEAILRALSTVVVHLLEAKRIDRVVEVAERAARSAQADLNVVLDAAASHVTYWDGELRNRFANDAFLRAFGLTRDEIRGRHASDVVGAAFFAEGGGPLMEAALRGEPQQFRRSITDPLGGKRHRAITFTPDRREGVVVGFVVTANDVTDLQNALVESEKSNALLELAEEAASLGHWRVTVEGSRTYWSPQIYRILGLEPAVEPNLVAALEAFHPEDRAAFETSLRRAIAEGEAFHLESRLERADGTRIVETWGQCELDPATGRTRAVIGVAQDVTAQHELRNRMARQQRLVTTGTLAAGVGHEINNPLTYVRANIEFAIDELRHATRISPSPRATEAIAVLDEAREGAERIRKIVQALRAFAVDEQPLRPTDVAAALGLATTMTAHELRSTASLVVELDGQPSVVSDESRLAQVLGNLLVNAAQAFVERDPERNRIVVRVESRRDGRLAIVVEDNGPGIPADVLPRIFDPFFTTKDVGLGTGLGLSISHNIVMAMGGEITCSTAVGEGTTFRVLLPAADPPGDALARSNEPRPSVPRGRVLIVDDDRAVARTMERVLRDEQDVVVLHDPREALRVLLDGETFFDVVLCDIAMPHMSGVELFERVRAARPALAASFVFVSGGARDEGLQAFFASVPNERLDKPFPDNDAVRTLARRYVAAPRTKSGKT